MTLFTGAALASGADQHPRDDASMLLYDHPLSSYSQKVKIALREKGLPFESVLPEDFGTAQRGTAFTASNPRGEVPVLLVDRQTPIFDSTVILE